MNLREVKQPERLGDTLAPENQYRTGGERRRAEGKALHEAVPRENHCGWKAPADRRDPVEVVLESNEGRLADLIPIGHGRMLQSPFAFYRGTAALMAADLAYTPVSGLRVQACGDAHLLNFGAFATPERNVIFYINDIDETLPAVGMGPQATFDDALCELAVEHADQAQRDYRAFVKGVREGRIKVTVES